ncbi:hypothetical protein R1flu_003732 [Riccia fluitans]|uniref:Uncharacterized protein n=1 Tax=Riccia fluitans TaxID=41844 RepID=A0ABD1YCV8_9MARC
MAYYCNRGMDPAPLLPLGVLMGVVCVVFTSRTREVLPIFMGIAQQMMPLMWIIPVLIIAAIFIMSADNYNTRPVYRYQYRYSSTYGCETGSTWGLLGLMLLVLLLLPWRY